MLFFIDYAVAGLVFDILGLTWDWIWSNIYGYSGLGLVVISALLLRRQVKREKRKKPSFEAQIDHIILGENAF